MNQSTLIVRQWYSTQKYFCCFCHVKTIMFLKSFLISNQLRLKTFEPTQTSPASARVATVCSQTIITQLRPIQADGVATHFVFERATFDPLLSRGQRFFLFLFPFRLSANRCRLCSTNHVYNTLIAHCMWHFACFFFWCWQLFYSDRVWSNTIAKLNCLFLGAS